jgi:tetratricopeptide (TPR) repeat protein
MRRLVRTCVIAAVAVAATTLLQLRTTHAQAPPEPKNLKVLPKNMSRREVIGVMRTFTSGLGVRCTQCHVSNKPGSDDPEDMDYAADKKDDKLTARKMMKMVNNINDEIKKMEIKNPPEVQCITCHHGVKVPQTLAMLLTATAADKGVDSTIVSYRALRDRYYGTGAYDFSPRSLNDVAGGLAQSKKDFDGAIKLIQLNLEFSPNDSFTYVTLGQVQLAKGDKTAAIASFQKAIDLDPENEWAKQQLEKAKSSQ